MIVLWGFTATTGFTAVAPIFTGSGSVNLFGGTTITGVSSFTNTGGVSINAKISETAQFNRPLTTVTSPITTVQGLLNIGGDFTIMGLTLTGSTTINVGTDSVIVGGSIMQGKRSGRFNDQYDRGIECYSICSGYGF